MNSLNIVSTGNIFFFYRPKVEHQAAKALEDIQRFYIILKPQKQASYTLIVVGKKKLPRERGDTFFAFVEKIAANKEELLNYLSEETYETITRGERHLEEARCLAEGKYAVIEHDQHTHLCFHMENPVHPENVQEEFHITEYGDYLISVKNPEQPSPEGIGLPQSQKARFPQDLETKFNDKRFLPLTSGDFLNYEGAEFLLISQETSDIISDKAHTENLYQCLKKIPKESVISKLEEQGKEEAIKPAIQKEWA